MSLPEQRRAAWPVRLPGELAVRFSGMPVKGLRPERSAVQSGVSRARFYTGCSAPNHRSRPIDSSSIAAFVKKVTSRPDGSDLQRFNFALSLYEFLLCPIELDIFQPITS
jgi:hypothetical protein